MSLHLLLLMLYLSFNRSKSSMAIKTKESIVNTFSLINNNKSCLSGHLILIIRDYRLRVRVLKQLYDGHYVFPSSFATTI